MPGVSGLNVEALFAPLLPSAVLGLAVSGGPDSLALMLLAAAWARAPGRPRLVVYTVDHGLRPEAADEAAMVVRAAEERGLAARLLRWEGDKPATGVQAAARAARYRLMAAAMAADGAELLLTAHHLADQAETVLMRLAHGSGVAGLAGMRARSVVEGCAVYRPLLGVPPEALAAVVAAAGLTPAADPSNADPAYERVRWRQAQPALDRLGLTAERLGVFARRMAAATALVAAAVDAAWPQIVVPVAGDRFELAHGRFAALNPLVAAELLARVLALAAGSRQAPPLGALETLQAALQGQAAMKATTLHGCVIAARAGVISVRREGPRRAGRRPAAAAASG